MPMFEHNAIYMYQPSICKTTEWLKSYIYVCMYQAEKKGLKVNCRETQQVLDWLSWQGRQNEPFCFGYGIYNCWPLVLDFVTYQNGFQPTVLNEMLTAYSTATAYCNTKPTEK